MQKTHKSRKICFDQCPTFKLQMINIIKNSLLDLFLFYYYCRCARSLVWFRCQYAFFVVQFAVRVRFECVFFNEKVCLLISLLSVISSQSLLKLFIICIYKHLTANDAIQWVYLQSSLFHTLSLWIRQFQMPCGTRWCLCRFNVQFFFSLISRRPISNNFFFVLLLFCLREWRFSRYYALIFSPWIQFTIVCKMHKFWFLFQYENRVVNNESERKLMIYAGFDFFRRIHNKNHNMMSQILSLNWRQFQRRWQILVWATWIE